MSEEPGLVLFTSKKLNITDIGLPLWIPRKYPWERSVNRINHELGKITDAFNYTISCETIEEILRDEPQNNKTFEEQAFSTALDIKRKTGDSRVYLMYSGGIDSTSALVSFMETWGDDLERLHIAMSYRSIDEFPEMWPLINSKFKGRIHNSLADTEEYYKRGYVVTGEHGDQIFGSDVLFKVVDTYGEAGIHMKWKNNIDMVYRRMFGIPFAPHISDFIDRHCQGIKHSPVPIRSCYDWVWWFNFVNKWQFVKYRLLATKQHSDAKLHFSKIINFYDTPSWQRWSMDNHHLKIKGTMLSYKYAAKKFIVDKTGFIDYINKPKVGSLQYVKSNFMSPDGIDTNLDIMPLERCLEFVNNDQ